MQCFYTLRVKEIRVTVNNLIKENKDKISFGVGEYLYTLYNLVFSCNDNDQVENNGITNLQNFY